MKLMFTLCCGSLIVPHPTNEVVRWCKCRKGACWWVDGAKGIFDIYHENYSDVYGIGLHNGLLTWPLDGSTMILSEDIKSIVEATPEYYFFKRLESLIIKFRPGATGDTHFIADKKQVPNTWEHAMIIEYHDDGSDNIEFASKPK